MNENAQNIPLSNRYPGLKPFTSDEEELFFGRDNDIANLYNLILVKQLVVLYGKSGFGKSSLINAGIFPKLKKEKKCHYFSIRFNNFSTTESKTSGLMPVETVVENFKKISSVQINQTPLEELTNGEQSFWYWAKTLQLSEPNQQYIVVFDQFEELFTYPQAEIDAFSKNLSEVLYTSIPVKYRKQLAQMDEAGKLDNKFHDSLYDIPDLKVVFSIRSDRLSLLNNLNEQHPLIFQNCYQLGPLTKEQAREAIFKPSQLIGNYLVPTFQYNDDTILKMLTGIAEKKNGSIETAVLQIICRYVEETLVNAQKKTNIQPEDLGNITEIFKKYYEGILDKLTGQARDDAQELIEEKLISGDLRNALPDTYIKQEFKIDQSLLDILEQSSLLRKERDAADRLLYEVSHDTLVKPILEVKSDRVAKKKKIEELAAAAEQERIKKDLQKQIDDERARVTQLEDLNKKVRRRSYIAWTFVGISLIMFVITIIYINSAKRSRQRELAQLYIANENLKTAEIFYDQTNQKEAQRLLGIAKSYMEYGEYQLALNNLKIAKSTLGITFASYQKRANSSQVAPKNLTATIQKEIDDKILACAQLIKKESNEKRN